MNAVEQFRAAHGRIEAGLAAAEAVATNPEALLTQLRALKNEVVTHFQQKDALYPALIEKCTAAGDVAGAQLTRIFDSNMRVQSAAVQRFFTSFESMAPPVVASSLKTITSVVRQRFGTEERAVFPIYLRTEKGTP